MITGQAQFCPQPTGCAWMVITLAYEPTVQFFWREAWDESWSVWSSYWCIPGVWWGDGQAQASAAESPETTTFSDGTAETKITRIK
jgi:hypothetical protein